MFKQLFASIGLLLAIGLPVWCLLRLMIRRYTAATAGREVVMLCFYLYMLAVAAMTVVPMRWTANRGTALNLVPVINLINGFAPTAASPPDQLAFHLQNVIGNLALLLPMGIFLPLLWKRFNRVGSVVAAGFLTSFLIETLQYVLQFIGSSRTADIDDVLLNTIGAGIGYYMYRAATLAVNSKEPKPVAV